jgi:hypothetical protein
MGIRSLASHIDDAVSILGGDDDYRRELLLFVLLYADPRDPIGEAMHKELVGKLYATTPHGEASLRAYKNRCVEAIFDQQTPVPSLAQPSEESGRSPA